MYLLPTRRPGFNLGYHEALVVIGVKFVSFGYLHIFREQFSEA